MVEETVVDVAKNEVTRQTVILIFSVAGTVLMLWAASTMADANSVRETKMRTALWAKRFAEKQRDKWQKLADDAATFYNREKL